MEKGYDIVSGGTDTHLILVDLSNRGITGKIAERALENSGITANKNMVPFDTQSPFVTSGIRIGTPALTTRGMKEEQMRIIASLIDKILTSPEDENITREVQNEVQNLCEQFPLYTLPN